MAGVNITVREDGPYIVRGPVEIKDPDGNVFPVARDVVALCRCGSSADKPFCDGSHAQLGPDAVTRAVEEGEARRE